jgi:chloride channel protein, CIC family
LQHYLLFSNLLWAACASALWRFGCRKYWGRGEHWLHPVWVAATPSTVLLVLPFAKILATALSVGTGGIGGVFFPGLVIGAFTGFVTHATVQALTQSAPFAIREIPSIDWFAADAMTAVIGAAAHAPMTAIFMTMAFCPASYGWFGVTLMALSVTVARLLVGERTLYPAQE